MMRAAVLGKPIEHSLSPVIHNAGYAATGLTDWTYTRHECDEDGLAAFVDGLGDDWAGLSLTMPLKAVALTVADVISPMSEAVGAANTLVLRDGRRVASNTDVIGMEHALTGLGVTVAEHVAVLGAGGTARAALGAAKGLKAEAVTVYARRREAIAELEPVAERLGLRLTAADWNDAAQAGRADLVVSTVPKGVADDLVPDWQPDAILFDVLYDPWPTPLAARAGAAGVRVLSGLDLLLEQAVGQWCMFTGRPEAPVDAMRAALWTAVGR